MKGIFFILFACLLWALDTLIRYPLVEKGISPIVIVFFEHALLTLFVLPKLIKNIPQIGRLNLSDVFSFLVIGLGGSALATVCFTSAFHFLNPSLVILLQKFQPVVAIFLAWSILKEPIAKPFIYLSLLCLIGAICVSAPDLEKIILLLKYHPERLTSDSAVKGLGLVALSVLGWGASTIFGKKLSLTGFGTESILAGRYFLGLVGLIFFIKWDQSLLMKDEFDYIRLMVMILFSGALGLWSYYQGLQRLPAKLCSILEMFFPLMAVMINWIVLGKGLTEIQIFGGVVLIVGALTLQIKKY